MTKKILVIFALALLTVVSAVARELSLEEAIARATYAPRTNSRVHKALVKPAELTLAYTATLNNRALLYVVNRPNSQGFLVLSGDDCAPALLGYTDAGSYDADDAPEALKWWISQYSSDIDVAVKNNVKINAPLVQHAAIPTLLQTTWAQEYPYYNDCTDLGYNCPVGCVATSMAQVMNYHKWPAQGTGSHSYKHNDANITISSDFSSHTYNWDIMCTSYFNNTAEEQAAIALLMRDCGVSVNMQYGKSASSAPSAGPAQALHTYFGYDKGITANYRMYMTDLEWETLLINELAAGRPLIYGGASLNEGGHSFVCDGYDGNGYYHFNWGWNGSFEGYFLMTGENTINPYSAYETHPYGTDSGYGFNNSQLAIAGIQPDRGGTLPPVVISMDQQYTLSTSTADRTSGWVFLSGAISNLSTVTANVSFGAMLVCDTDTFYTCYSSAKNTSFEIGTFATGFYFQCTGVVKNGTYQVYPVYKDNTETNAQWKKMYMSDDIVAPTLEVTGTEPVMYLTSRPYLTSEGKQTSDNKVTTADMHLHFEVEAITDFEDKYISPYIYPTGSGLASAIGYFNVDGLSLKAGERRSFDITSKYIYYGKSLDVGSTYYISIKLDGSSGTLLPEDYAKVYFTIVDEMPEPEPEPEEPETPTFNPDVTNNGYITVADVATCIRGIRANDENYKTENIVEIVKVILEGAATGKPETVTPVVTPDPDPEPDPDPQPTVTTCPVADVAYALEAEGYEGVYLDVETGVADGNKTYSNSVGFSSTPKAVYFEQSGTSWLIKNANGKYISMPNSWNVVITDASTATWTVNEVESGYVTITKSSNANNYWSGDAADATNIADGMPVYCDKTTALRFKWTLFKE